MRKHRVLIGVVAAVVLLGGVLYVTLGRYVFARGTTTPVPLEEIEQRYFASTTTTATGGSAAPNAPGTSAPDQGVAVLPPPGVYVYATSGSDRIDALGGDHHDYPATTTITVTEAGCGVQQRWDVLEERWEAWQRCVAADDGSSVDEPARTNYDEFFATGVREDYTCTGDSRPLQAGAGTTWTTTCTDQAGDAETHAGTVIGAEQRQVAGTAVATMHVSVVVTDEDSRNLQTIDTWYLEGTDLVVAQTSTDHAVNPSPIGDVDYDEQYSIELTSLRPVTAG